MDGPLNGLAGRIAWGDASLPLPQGTPELLRPKVGSEVELILLDAAAVPVWLHWTGKRTVPHLTGAEGCPLCHTAEPARLWAYISAWDVHRKMIGLAELTEYAVSRCPEVLQPSTARPLRGRHCLLSRSTGHRSARCRIKLLAATYRGTLPEGLNVRAVLEHLWGYDGETRRALGADLPHRPREEDSGDAD